MVQRAQKGARTRATLHRAPPSVMFGDAVHKAVSMVITVTCASSSAVDVSTIRAYNITEHAWAGVIKATQRLMGSVQLPRLRKKSHSHGILYC